MQTAAKKALFCSALVFFLSGCTHGERYKTVALPLQASLQSSISRQLDSYQPGSHSAETNKKLKQAISGCFQKFSTVGTLKLSGDDKKVRPIGVGIQTIFEQSLYELLENKTISKAVAIIHTKTPATPLVTPEKTAPHEAMSAQMQGDSTREKTISDRTITVRNLAKSDPERMTLYIAYPEEGLHVRTPEQLETYRAELAKPENKSLKDLPLSLTIMPNNLVGASYILTGADASKESESQPLYFGLNAVQAVHAGETKMDWTFWLGALDNAEVEPHYQEVKSYLEKGSPTDLNLP
ncbi:hypothetical protein [Endozoicomonas sp. SCSIO W0465]|uniref:hypothetical protein n=1 Tax=Endozoicomonas sp. SCSIO W0465 TaxID=2918516 RepID=UPI0020759675|nr:hypothetical protein [Endozoicomonas sp. SCSIO W0465]USE35622.1 hypothetical protein MJO57_26635 [Endozoicomonas sp. SCSIO W0465]